MEDKNSLLPSSLSLSGSAPYIPPARLALLLSEEAKAAAADRSSEAYQRLSWDALKKSINGLINKVNINNIKNIIPELFSENLIRGRGLLIKSMMKAQAASLPFTSVYAALLCVLNSKLPMLGELALKRLILAFRKSYRRNDKSGCLAHTMFIAHLTNQGVIHEILSLQLLTLLLEKPTDDSVEIAVGFMKEIGCFLSDIAPKPMSILMERFRAILHEGNIDKRVQYMIEVLFQIRKEKFKDFPVKKAGLDLIEEEDIVTHSISLDEEDIDAEEELNVFKYQKEGFLESEDEYAMIRKEILGEEEEEQHLEQEDENQEEPPQENSMQIIDQTGFDLITLRKTLYLTLMSSLDFEECTHKILKLGVPPELHQEIANMIVDCGVQERTYNKFHGLLAERFCRVSEEWSNFFAGSFANTYETVHRLETNKIRNAAKIFCHLLGTEAISWGVLTIIQLTETETTSAGRIFIKILFQELLEFLGLKNLLNKIKEEEANLTGLFPGYGSDPRNLRFSINFFTAIGLGPLTEDMRNVLKSTDSATTSAPKRINY